MITKYIDVGDNKWGVIVCYDYNLLDFDDMWAIMRSFGLSGAKADDSLRILSELNTGMAISNEDLRMSVIFIGDVVNESEWWSTLNHELLHVGNAIINYYDEDFDGEPAAYLQGYLMKSVVEKVAYPCY